MDRQLLHTPEGVRDIYAEECARKLAVQKKIQNVFRLYGYQDIETPVFEFFDIFKKERGSAGTREMYKFLTGRTTHWYCARTLPLLLPDVWQNISEKRPDLCGCATLGQPF